MSDKREEEPFADELNTDNTGESRADAYQSHEHESQKHEENETISRIRKKHQKLKSKVNKIRKSGRQRLIFWIQTLLVLFICITVGLTIRAFEMTTINSGGVSWFDELKQGNYDVAAEKFSISASAAISQVFSSNLSIESIMKDFNAALPHLRKAGYILSEMEVEIGIPPKLIPHFYHNPKIKLDLEKTLKAIGDNSIGRALIIALAEAAELQKQVEMADLRFNHVEVELGPIPSLKLKYMNDVDYDAYLDKQINDYLRKNTR